MGRLTGKVAFISGVARGQGRSHAVAMAGEGADIIGIDLCEDIETNRYPLASPSDLDETVKLVEVLDRRILATVADVRDPSALRAALADGVAQLGRLDIVVANAGIAPLGGDLPSAAFADVVDVNLVGVINTVHAALPHLSAGASIIATGSLAAFLRGSVDNPSSGPGGLGYGFAKKALANYVHDLALCLARDNIRVNAVHPTNTNTDMLHSAPMYAQFRPDLEAPDAGGRRAEVPGVAGDADPVGGAQRHQPRGGLPRLGRVALRHRHATADRRRRVPEDSSVPRVSRASGVRP